MIPVVTTNQRKTQKETKMSKEEWIKFWKLLYKSLNITIRRCWFVYAAYLMFFMQFTVSTEAAETMESTLDHYKVEILTQTPQGKDTLKGNLWYVDGGEGPEALVNRAVDDFFKSCELEREDYILSWKEQSFEGLVEMNEGMLTKQYRVKIIFRRKDTAAPPPVEGTINREVAIEHKLPTHEGAIAAPVLLIIFIMAGHEASKEYKWHEEAEEEEDE